MARKRNKENPWIGYEDQVRKRLNSALNGCGSQVKRSVAMRECGTKEQSRINRKRLMELIAGITNRKACTGTLRGWLKDPGKVSADMAELLSLLLGFDDAEHVKTGDVLSYRRMREKERQAMMQADLAYIDEATGYLTMLRENDRQRALELLRDLAAQGYKGPERGETLEQLMRIKAKDAGKRSRENHEAYENKAQSVHAFPPEWVARFPEELKERAGRRGI